MGGREGSRGYLYQAIASVLNSLNENNWEYVQLEPDSQNDKIDVMWEYGDGTKKATQIKSSYNNLPQADIKNWLEELINDAEDANHLSLLLIGTCSDTTKKYINRINKLKSTDPIVGDELSDIIKSRLDNISIQLENFDQEAMETKINVALDRFLEGKGNSVSYSIREMMVGAIIHTFFRFSTNGQKVSREAFEQKILEWVNFNFPQVKGANLAKKNLLVYFYLKQKVDFSTRFEGLNFKFYNPPYVKRLKEELLAVMNDIKDVDLSVEDMEFVNKEALSSAAQGLGLGLRFKTKNLFQDIPKSDTNNAEISDEEKEKYIVKTRNLLEESIQKDFFCVGELKVGSSSRQSIIPSTSLFGTDLEKKKWKLIKTFIQELNYLEMVINYLEYLNSFFVIPLVLKNEGEVFDEDIKVTLHFPESVTVATKDSFEAPNSIDFINLLIGTGGMFNRVMRHHEDSKVMENVNPNTNFQTPIMDPREVVKLEPNKKKFRKYLDSFHNCEVFTESNSTIIKYCFDKLNVSDSISFPTYILVNANDSFEIKYEITSKNLNSLIKGKLFYEI